MESKNKKVTKKNGIVVAVNMKKTVVVAVETLKTHSKYKKKYISTRKYKVHDEENKCKVGDEIEMVPVRPISKEKFYKIV